MEHQEREKKLRYIELAITLLLSIHHFSMGLTSLSFGWPDWLAVLITAFVVFNWILVLGRFQTLTVRTILSAVLFDCSISFYAYFSGDMMDIIIPFITINVVLAFYGYGWFIIPSLITLAEVLLVQIFLVKSIDIRDPHQVSSTFFTVINTLMVIALLAFWIRIRNQNDAQQKEDLQALVTAQKGKDDFIANVSHEIRTPINTISGLSDILVEEENPQELKDDLQRIRIAGKSLMLVVSDILDFSELENGVISLEEEHYNISSTIQDLIHMSLAQRPDKPIEFLINYPADLPRGLYGDEKKIRRALMNIISNAFKFTEEGSVVVDISWRKESYGMNLCISVRDTGIGMKPETMENLFTVYNQADAGRSRAASGVGLGIAITRALVQKMGGTISTYSTYGKGSEFRLVIPQKITDENPIVTIKKADEVYVAIYINFERISVAETCDEYAKAIEQLRRELGIRTIFCRSLEELKRRQEENTFSHLFISISEYIEDQEYFDKLSEQLKLMVVLEPQNTKIIENPKIRQVLKPLHLMPIAQAINEESPEENDFVTLRTKKFMAPDVKVLVVDDNEMNIRVIAGLLNRYKIKAVEANSGREALEKIRSADYDFVFMDHMMPEMDGVETLHHIRENSGLYYKEVPVIALTANAVAGAREMLLAEGFDDFIEKPVEISVLERLLLRTIKGEKILSVEDDEEQEPKEMPKQTKTDALYGYGNLNLEQGQVYCGGYEALEDILRIYAEKGPENYMPLLDLFEAKNWKDYTIAIHAVKSSMKAIGAEEISKKAQALEEAGRNGDISFILDHHKETFELYQSLILDLMRQFGVSLPAEEENLADLPEFSDEEMQKLKIALEDAMYKLDGNAMLSLISPARGKRYHGTALDPVIASVEKKIQMSDYMSAAETFAKIK